MSDMENVVGGLRAQAGLSQVFYEELVGLGNSVGGWGG